MYVEDEDLHIILVNNADIEHYKQILNDDNVIYHYTDISYTDLIGIRICSETTTKDLILSLLL